MRIEKYSFPQQDRFDNGNPDSGPYDALEWAYRGQVLHNGGDNGEYGILAGRRGTQNTSPLSVDVAGLVVSVHPGAGLVRGVSGRRRGVDPDDRLGGVAGGD